MQGKFLKWFTILLMIFSTTAVSAQYTMPIETAEHEGTWLQWPHNKTYPPFYRDDLEPTWVEMTRELIKGENVHIIAYNNAEKNHIIATLNNEGVSLTNVDFYIHQNDDCWVRDNGPIFVYDAANERTILDWGFDGWGNDTPYALCDLIPDAVATDLTLPSVDLSAMVLEGGAIEVDGEGTLLATISSILGDNRNPGMTLAQAETYLTNNLGVSNFIWLQGVYGGNDDITDMHIDGFAKFHDSDTIVCMNAADLAYWEVPAADITTLMNAEDAAGNPYEYVFLPLTDNNVFTTWGEDIGIKGSYVNYYIGNAVVLVPWYNDPKDAVAISILEDLYPGREVVGVDCRNLYYGGGMIHCVTQQQPAEIIPLPVEMVYFEIEGNDCEMWLRWGTASEQNNEKFIVERSSDSKNFEAIGEVPGQGTLSQNSSYTFVDKYPLATNYYRLRQVDVDGKEEISQLLFAQKSCEHQMEIVALPNITSDQITVLLTGGQNTTVAIQLVSGQGAVLQRFGLEHRAGKSELVIPVEHLPEGIYYLQLISVENSMMVSKSFVVAR